MDVPLPNPGEMWGSQRRALVTRVPSSALSSDVSGSSSGLSPTCLGVLFQKDLHYSREDWGLLRVEDNEGGRTERPRAVLASAESRQERKDARLGDMGGNETGECLGVDETGETTRH